MGSICLLSPKRGLPRGLGRGGCWDASPPRRSASEHTLQQLPLFKQKTSWRMIYRFHRLFRPGEIAPGASSVSGKPRGTAGSELFNPPRALTQRGPLAQTVYCRLLRGRSRPRARAQDTWDPSDRRGKGMSAASHTHWTPPGPRDGTRRTQGHKSRKPWRVSCIQVPN